MRTIGKKTDAKSQPSASRSLFTNKGSLRQMIMPTICENMAGDSDNSEAAEMSLSGRKTVNFVDIMQYHAHLEGDAVSVNENPVLRSNVSVFSLMTENSDKSDNFCLEEQ